MQQSGSDNTQIYGDNNIVIDQVNVFEIKHPNKEKDHRDNPMDTKAFRYMSRKTAMIMFAFLLLAPAYMLYALLVERSHVTFYNWWGMLVYAGTIIGIFRFIPYFRSVTWINPKLGFLNIEDKHIYFDEIRRIELAFVENQERKFRVYRWGDVLPASILLPNEHAAKYMFDAVRYGMRD